MKLDLDGRSALVTGGSSGIGRATALALANEGARVTIVAMDEAKAMAVISEITAGGGKAIFVSANVRVPEQVEAAVAAAVEAFGGLDCAVNSAAVSLGTGTPTAEFAIDLFDDAVAVNLRGVFLSMKYELR